MSASEISLSWRDNSKSQASFKILRAPDEQGQPGLWTQIVAVDPFVINFNDANLSANRKYWYRLRAHSHDGDTEYRNYAEATTFSLPPTNLAATVRSATMIRLSWTPDASGQSGFKIERAPDSGGNPGTWAWIATVPDGQTNFDDSGASSGATYWYRVSAYNAAGDSGYSGLASAMTPCLLSLNAWGLPGLIQPPDVADVVGIAAGFQHGLALKSNGTVVAWGNNDYGQAAPPTNLTGIVAIAAGGEHSLALKSDGTVVAWGSDSSGEVSGATNFSGISAIAAGASHSLALRSDGTVVAWGANYSGQATPPTNLTGIVAIAAGDEHSLALKSDGTVVAWGYNYFGEATPPAKLTGIVAIAAGAYHSLALKSDGTVVGWGNDAYGQISGATNLSGVVAIAAGGYHSLALDTNGSVIGWGANDSGQSEPDGLTGRVTAIAAGFSFSLGITAAPAEPSAGHANLLAPNSLMLSWTDNSANEDGFRVQRAPDNGSNAPADWVLLGTAPANTAEFLDTSVISNATYWYRIQSFDACGDSPWSFPVSVSVVPPAPPFFYYGTPGFAGLDLFWYEQWPDVDGFRIERANDNNGSPGAWEEIATIGTTNTSLGFKGYYNDLDVLANATYWYRARAFNAVGISDYSGATAMQVVPPHTPNSFLAAPFANQARLWWYYQTLGVVGFKIQRAPDNAGAPGTWVPLATLAPTNSNNGYYSYSDPGLALNATYWYRLIAFNWAGDSDFSSPVEVTIVPPGAPYSLAATVGNTNQVSVFWSDNVGDQDGFRIERAPDNGGVPGTWGEIATLMASNTTYAQYTDTTVTANTTNWYRVRAFNLFGNSPYSSAIQLYVVPPPAPSSVSASVFADQAKLSWDSSYGNYGYVDGFIILRATDVGGSPGDWTEIATVGASISSYIDANRALGVTYWYTVRAFNWIGVSPDANPASVTIVGPAPPYAPSALIGSNNDVDLSWYADSLQDEDGFKIERAPDVGGIPGTWTEIGTVVASHADAGEFADTTVTANTTNWYRVRAFNVLGDSDSSPPTSIAVVPPSAPSLSASPFVDRVNLAWSANYSGYGSVDGFRIERAPDNGGIPGNWTPIGAVGAGVLHFTDSGLVPDATFWYRMRAYNWVGDGPYSSNTSATIVRPEHHFTGISVAPDGAVMLGLNGSVLTLPGFTGASTNDLGQMFDLYFVDTSTDLVHWTRLEQVLHTNNNPQPLVIQDTNAAGLDKRFYRIITNQLPTFVPPPTGPFSVGLVDRVMMDPARTNLYRYIPPTNTFMVSFWYPADSPPLGALPTTHYDPLYALSYWGVSNPSWAAAAQRLVQMAYIGLPPTTNIGTFPVVILSHGLGSFRKTFQPLAVELASHGYIVISPDHSDCAGSAFPDGRFLRSSGEDVPGRLKDIQFLVNQLTEINKSDPLLAGRLDSEHVGVFGHSYGGEVVVIGRTNAQVKCAAIYDATNFQLIPNSLQKPLLVALGAANHFYTLDLALFTKDTNNAVFFQLSGADHNTCADAGWLEISTREQNRAFCNSMLWFFDTYLKGQKPVFPTNAVMYNLQIK